MTTGIEVTIHCQRPCAKSDGFADDFRTALNQANSHLISLATLSRPGAAASVIASSSTMSTTSSELDRARIDIMNKLVSLLQRNLRVRYELSVSEVVQASVPFLASVHRESAHEMPQV